MRLTTKKRLKSSKQSEFIKGLGKGPFEKRYPTPKLITPAKLADLQSLLELNPPGCQKCYKDLMPSTVTHAKDYDADSMQSDLEDGELCLSFIKRQRTLSKETLATLASMAKESTATVSTRRREALKATLATPPSMAKKSTATVSTRQREASKATLATPPSMAKASKVKLSTRRWEARKATNSIHVGADNHTVAEYLTLDASKQLRQAAIDNEDNLTVDSSNQIIDTDAASNDDLHADCGHHAENTAGCLTAYASNQLEPLRILMRIRNPTSIGTAYVASLKCKRKEIDMMF